MGTAGSQRPESNTKALPASRAREGMREGRGSDLRSGMQESWQARRVGVSKMGGNVEKAERQRMGGSYKAGMYTGPDSPSGSRSWQK